MSFELPAMPQLPPFLTATPRYEEEAARLMEAEISLRQAHRIASNARNGHKYTAWDLLEKQVVVPFENLVSAQKYCVENGDPLLLSDWEEDVLEGTAMTLRLHWKQRKVAAFEEIDNADVACLFRLFPEALKVEPLDDGDRSIKHVLGNEILTEDDYKDWTPVIEAALRDIANRGGREG